MIHFIKSLVDHSWAKQISVSTFVFMVASGKQQPFKLYLSKLFFKYQTRLLNLAGHTQAISMDAWA